MSEEQKVLTWRELKEKVATFTDEQLAMRVRWWGDERGGEVRRLDVLPEPYVCMDEYYEPRSAYEGDQGNDLDADATAPPLPAGTPILSVD